MILTRDERIGVLAMDLFGTLSGHGDPGCLLFNRFSVVIIGPVICGGHIDAGKSDDDHQWCLQS